jgi:hypothetical protein
VEQTSSTSLNDSTPGLWTSGFRERVGSARPTRQQGNVMWKAAVLGLTLSFVWVMQSLAGDTHEKILQDAIGTLNDATKILTSVKDEASANKAQPELKKVVKRFLDLKLKADTLPKPSDEDKEKLKKYKKDLEGALKNLLTEIARVGSLPGDASKVIRELDKLK